MRSKVAKLCGNNHHQPGTCDDTVPQVEALYIHNFEEGMHDAQLEHLSRVLKQGRIWALNVGENFKLSAEAWIKFANEIP
jgi:hypothetical protein